MRSIGYEFSAIIFATPPSSSARTVAYQSSPRAGARAAETGPLRGRSAERFVRVHRSIVVNTERIREVQPWFKGDYVLILNDGTKLRSGRTYRAVVQALIE